MPTDIPRVCGIVAIARGGRVPCSVSERQAIKMRDALAHRGPDGAGVWSAPGVFLGQRRLEVIAPGEPGHQPMLSRDGRWALVYNGELYNDAALRTELARMGHEPDCESDTATVCQVLSAWGPRGLERCRGMFAIAAFDTHEQRLVLARDPLGIKPLYYALAQPPGGGGPELVVASEVTAIFEHPAISPQIDPIGLAAYLTTIRVSTEGRTLFDGVSMLMPGRVEELDLRNAELSSESWDLPIEADTGTDVRACLEDSVVRHLRSDVPVCVLLSGGLDSTIIAGLTQEHRVRLPTFGAGDQSNAADGDLAHARELAAQWGLPHHAIRMSQTRFTRGVRTLIERTGQPVSTPNETAIHALGCAIRAGGCKVALTGEGADELFGGYHAPLTRAAAYIESDGNDPAIDFLVGHAWVPPPAMPKLLSPKLARLGDFSQWLADAYRHAYEQELGRPGPPVSQADEAMRGHMRLVRRINLTGLLQRVDSALSQSGVEGRTPFADRIVASLADRLPMDRKFDGSLPPHEGTKIALRDSFDGIVPDKIRARPKASFPLPFQDWLAPLFADLDGEPLIDELFSREAWELVRSAPHQHWSLAWPMINVGLWARRWFA
ncbi:MAG: asparagine synthase (glutamine-hydrolyzing) [Planctomycetota bacterium]